MTKWRVAFVVLIGVFLPSSAWGISQGASCRGGVRPQNHAPRITLVCWASQDPWQDCDEDPWQLSSWVSARDTFSDPWQDSADPWQPFVAQSIAKLPARALNDKDPWRAMQVRVVKISTVTAVRDSFEDPWQPAFSDPWQDDLEDPWQ